MPIDLRLVVQDESLLIGLKTSLTERENQPCQANADATLTHLRDLQSETKLTKQRIEAYRSQLRKKQVTDKDKLQELKAACRKASDNLQQLLYMIPNYLDLSIRSRLDDDNEQEITRTAINDHGKIQNSDQSLNQTMFCIGAYESISENLFALTERGTGILEGIRKYMLSSCSRIPEIKLFKTFELPVAIPLDMMVQQSRCGSTAPPQSRLSDGMIMTPSWLALLEHHLTREEHYFDRVLPQGFILDCREMQQNASPSAQRSMASLWYEKLSIRQEIQVLLVVGPSLSVDSRPLQLTWMHQIREFYLRLAPRAILKIRSTEPSKLMQHEASKLVLEGYLPQSGNQIIQLATLSNLLDYCSQGLRHGNSIDKRCVHLLVGTVCHVGLASEWMIQHCVHGHESIHLPSFVSPEKVIPFCRRIVRKKGGRQYVQTLPTPAHPPVQDSGSIVERESIPIISDPPFRQPTMERIKQEAASCPFDFLPFYGR